MHSLTASHNNHSKFLVLVWYSATPYLPVPTEEITDATPFQDYDFTADVWEFYALDVYAATCSAITRFRSAKPEQRIVIIQCFDASGNCYLVQPKPSPLVVLPSIKRDSGQSDDGVHV